jgi:hypothetical protein
MKEVRMCKACEDRGQTWNGDSPSCAFDERGVFTSDNWNCATMNKLRALAEDRSVWNEDQYCSIIPFKDEGTYIVLSWYKHRGRTQGAWFVDEDTIAPLVLEKAEELI